ncbi:hypothetical protein Tco_0536183 [Tanacetum coccineum]
MQNTMAEQNVPAQAPTRTDEHILPPSSWLQIGKSNLLFDAQKIQKNLIFQISVDILRNTNFFRAFSASASIPAIYIQQFWNTMKYDEKTGVYCCQVDEQWFNLSVDLLRKALDITPVDPAHPFELPPTGDTVIDFVNQLGYPEPVEFISNIRVNYVYQPWRAILSLINQCLTGKTSGSDKPRHPVLQMLWGIITKTNIDHAELLWEEFTQGIQTFFSHKASHKASLKDPKKKAVPLLIPYGRFTKMIIYYLGSTFYRNVKHRRDQAPHDSTMGPSSEPQDDTSEKVVHESSSTTDSERTESGTEATAPKVDKEQGEVASTTVTSGLGISVHTKNQARSDPGQGHEALAGLNLEAMQEDSGPRKEHVTLAGPNHEHMDEDFYATSYSKVHENLKLRTDEHVILENPESSSATLSSMKNLDETDNFRDQFLNGKPIEDDHEKTNVVMSAPPVNAPVINISSPTPSSQVNTPPINTETTTIITTLPKITPFIALQLRVAKLEQDMSEVKKTNHSAAILASIQSQVPTVIEKYLGTKIDAALLKALERHTADLVEKYSVLPALESSKKQESEKSLKEIIRIKREQGEKKPEPMYTIKLTDKATLEEFDLKGALFNIMHKNKSANRNPANYRLYHALMEALIEDENAMEKEVADKVKDHKRKHDSNDDEDDDDEGPSARSNQGDSTKRRRHDSSTSGSTQPPFKDSEQSPSMQRTDHQSEQSSDDNLITDEGHVSDPEDTDNAHIPKVPAATWFKPIPEEERPATPEPEWTIPSNDYPEPENN